MDDTERISNITYARTRADLWVVTFGDQKIGTLRGNYSTGFWAYLNDGERLEGTYPEPGEAAKVLNLEALVRTPEPARLSRVATAT